MGFLSVIGLIIQVVFGLILLIAFFLHLSETRRYLGVGALTALLVFVVDVAALALFLPSVDYYDVIILILAFLRVMVNTSVGMYYCASLQVPSFAFWGRGLVRPAPIPPPAEFPPPPGEPAVEVPPTPSGEPLLETSGLFQPPSPEPPAPPPSSYQYPTEGQAINWRSSLLAALAVAAGGVIFSILLFLLVPPRVASPFHGRPGFSFIDPLVLLEAAFVEEIAFRMCIQNYLARVLRLPKRGYWLAIVLSAAFWALAHGEVLDPAWVKLAQVFPMGLGLGYLARRWGLESSILAHAVFNLTLLLLSPWLVGA